MYTQCYKGSSYVMHGRFSVTCTKVKCVLSAGGGFFITGYQVELSHCGPGGSKEKDRKVDTVSLEDIAR